MAKPNGREKRAIEGLAAALQECFNVAREQSEARIDEKLDKRFKPVNETLRMIWRQSGGDRDRRLPIDD